jgi:hypothetical protein
MNLIGLITGWVVGTPAPPVPPAPPAPPAPPLLAVAAASMLCAATLPVMAAWLAVPIR